MIRIEVMAVRITALISVIAVPHRKTAIVFNEPGKLIDRKNTIQIYGSSHIVS